MGKIIFTKGLQGSGKSTWAKDFCTKNRDWVRVSRDDLRNMRGIYWLPKQEDLITKMEDACIHAALNSGYNVVVDSMNLSDDKVKSRVAVIKKEFEIWGEKLTWMYKDFTHVPLEECIRNDLKRPNSIGEKVIRETYNKYLAKDERIAQNPELERAIIVDIDGTLAQMVGRSPYDWDRVGEDEVIQPVAEIVRRFRNTHNILLLSGRDEVCRPQTHEWLVSNQIPYDYLWMRPHESMEKDTVIKRRLFDEHIKDKFYVDFVIDDRMCMKKMWHSLGFTLLGVGDPLADF